MVDSIYQIATCKLIAMELIREHFRAMIFYDFKVGLSESQCVDRLQSAFRDSAPSRATVFRWFGEFKRGRGSVEDEKRSGRPASAVTDENIVAVQQMIKEDQRCTYKDIEGTLGISSPSVNEILHEKFGVRKLAARWVPHNLSEEQKRVRINWCREMLERFNKGDSRRIFDIVTGDESWIYQYDPETKRQSTVWVFPDDAPPVKVKRGRSVGKKMVASFFSASGHVVTVPLENQATVTAKWYFGKHHMLAKAFLKASGETAKDRVVWVVAAPGQRLCSHSKNHEGLSSRVNDSSFGPSSLQSRPCSLRLLFVSKSQK